uniref:Gustatory receptor n=1 Tax=Strigamia maritima TaxID=126957 RepID=T1JPB0_STRMM
MQDTFSKNYAVKANKNFKYVFLLFGLSISPPQGRCYRWLLLIAFLLCFSCQLIGFIHVVVTITAYFLNNKLNTEGILILISYILTIFPALLTYIYVYFRRFAISSVLQKLSDLSSSKTFTKNQWRKQMFQMILFTLLHLILIITLLKTFITNQPFLEWVCVIRLISKKNCKDPSTLTKFGFGICLMTEIVFFNFFSHLFLSTIFCFFSHICTLVVLHFQQMDDTINRIINAKLFVSSDKLTKFERDFFVGERMTNEVSRIFSSILLIWWSNLLVRVCLRFRISLKAASGTFGGFIELFIEILRLYVLYKKASAINKKANLVSQNFASLKLMDGVNFRNNHTYFHVLSTHVGISVSDLFLINSQTILTVMANIFTYAVIMFQT